MKQREEIESGLSLETLETTPSDSTQYIPDVADNQEQPTQYLLNSNRKVSRHPLTPTIHTTTVPTWLPICTGTRKPRRRETLDIKQERWLRCKALENTCYIWLHHSQSLANVLWLQSHAFWKAGYRVDLGEYICVNTPWSDNTTGFGIIVWSMDFLLSFFSKLLVLQENKSTTPKLFSWELNSQQISLSQTW